jgi:hypothetical protein
MKKILLKFVSKTGILLSLTAFTPLLVNAAVTDVCDGISNPFGRLLCTVQQYLNALIPIIIALGVVYFVWGVVRFMIADSEEAKTKGKDTIIYGIIGLAVIVGFWGLVNIVVNSLGFTSGQLNAPTLAPIASATSSDTCENSAGNFQGLVKFIICLINNSIIPLFFAIAIMMFIWGAVKFFIINADEEAQRDQGKQFMIWGIIALTVMTTVWGIVGILGSTFGVNSKVLPQVCPPSSEQCK